MKKLMMYLLNLPAYTLLAASNVLRVTFKTYFIDSWRDVAATQYPFWKWTNWASVWNDWKNILKPTKESVE